MTQVFISYARSTAPQAQAVAEALIALGYGVWRDDELPAHRAYSEVIEEQLRAASAVITIWSADAVKSHWVRAEANAAMQAGTLVQLSVDGITPPMPFSQIQCADLTGWAGDLEAPGWRKVVASVADLVGEAGPSSSRRPAAVPAAVEPLLAVLAFDNLSGDPEMAYFSDGVSEEIQQTVAHGTDLKVIGRTSSFRYRGPDKAAKRVAADLNATHVLDGSVRRSGARVRISAQLIECVKETTLWSDRFDRDLTDIFALQDEIAAAVAAALKVVFAPTVKATAIDPAAYDLYLQARAALAGPGDLGAVRVAAIAPLERAVALASGFARAWAQLGHLRAWLLRNAQSDQPYAVLRAKVVEAAETALRLDPAQGLPYQALATLEPFANYAEREALHGKALAAAPNDPDVLVDARRFFSGLGRNGEALAYAKHAYDLDPMNFEAAYAYAIGLTAVDRYQDARVIEDWLLTQWPKSELAIYVAASFASYQGDWARFDDMVRRAQDAGPLNALTAAAVEWGQLRRDADPSRTQGFLRRARDDFARTKTVTLSTLGYLGGLGLADEAFALVDEASFGFMFDAEQRWAAVSAQGSLFNDAFNKPMMRKPHFPRLCAKLGLCDYWVKTNRWPDCSEEGVLPYDFKAECRRLAGANA